MRVENSYVETGFEGKNYMRICVLFQENENLCPFLEVANMMNIFHK